MSAIRDILSVARFEIFRALRSWQMLSMLLLFVLINIGSVKLLATTLGMMEQAVAATAGIPARKKPGGMMDQLVDLPRFQSMITELGFDQAELQTLLGWGVVALVYFATSAMMVPYLSALSASDAISGDLHSRSLRFELLRTGRGELIVGRFVGQVMMLAVCLGVSMLAVWGAAMYWLVVDEPLSTLSGLVLFGGRSLFWIMPFAALGVSLSTFTTSSNWARIMALLATTAILVLSAVSTADGAVVWVKALRPLLPFTWLSNLQQGGSEMLVAVGVCVGMALLYLMPGILVFSKRDV